MKLETTLPALSFDYEGLKKWAEGITAKYKDLVVKEDEVKDIKKIMADLNKTKDALETARKETVRQVSAPIKEFEDQIKDVVKIIVDARSGLDTQVKAFIQKEREQKRSEVQFIIENLTSEHEVPDLKIDIEETWLNKSKDLKDVTAAIEGIILAHLKEVQDAKALAQAKQDRAAYIEQQCSSYSGQYGVEIQPSTFMRLHDLNIPLGDVNEQIENSFKLKASTRPPGAAPVVAEEPVQAVQTQAPAQSFAPRPPVPPSSTNRKRIVVEIEYDSDKEMAVQNALNNMQSICSVRLINNAQAAA